MDLETYLVQNSGCEDLEVATPGDPQLVKIRPHLRGLCQLLRAWGLKILVYRFALQVGVSQRPKLEGGKKDILGWNQDFKVVKKLTENSPSRRLAGRCRQSWTRGCGWTSPCRGCRGSCRWSRSGTWGGASGLPAPLDQQFSDCDWADCEKESLHRFTHDQQQFWAESAKNGPQGQSKGQLLSTSGQTLNANANFTNSAIGNTL